MLHFGLVQLHPLAPKLHQRRFGLHQLCPFVRANGAIANGQLIAILHQGVDGKVAFGVVVAARRFALGLEPHLGPLPPLGGPPGGHHHPISGILQHPGRLFEEVKGGVEIDKNPHGLVGL